MSIKNVSLFVVFLAVLSLPSRVSAIDIVLDFAMDEMNENWFDPTTPDGNARREAVQSAADFLSTVITNDDWLPLGRPGRNDDFPGSLGQFFRVNDIKAETIRGPSGELLVGTDESDGEGFVYSVPTSNRAGVAENTYVVYVTAFEVDDGATGVLAGGRADGNVKRNVAAINGSEFNTWGGNIGFNTAVDFYVGSPPGINPTDDYGFQSFEDWPEFDTQSDNWEWSEPPQKWSGFDLPSIDSDAVGKQDLYTSALHELFHTLGVDSTRFEDQVGLDDDGNLIGENVVEVYGGPVPAVFGHFAASTQSEVWDSPRIISEATLDVGTVAGTRKYVTKLDMALLRDIGYDVLHTWPGLPADIDADGDVTFADFLILSTEFGRSGMAIRDPRADINENGKVDFADFLRLSSDFGSATASTHVVPEPTGNRLLMLLLLFTAVQLRHGRKM